MKTFLSIVKEFFRYIILVPFIPLLVIMMWAFAEALKFHGEIPEDLDEQYKPTNKNMEQNNRI
jgi:hypothetical protein